MVKKITSTLTPLLPLPCVAQAPSLLEYKHDIVVLFYHPIPTWCHRPLGGDITIVDGDGWAYWKQSYEGTIIKEIGRGGGGVLETMLKQWWWWLGLVRRWCTVAWRCKCDTCWHEGLEAWVWRRKGGSCHLFQNNYSEIWYASEIVISEYENYILE